MMPTLCVVFDSILEKESKLHPTNLLGDEKLGMKSLEKFYLCVVFIYIGFKIYGQMEFNVRMVST